MRGETKSGLSAGTIVLLFAVVLALYLAVFFGIERARQHKGPWEVDFQTNAGGSPVLIVSQAKLGLSDVKIVVHGENASNPTGRVSFNQVKQPVPVGRVIYEDLGGAGRVLDPGGARGVRARVSRRALSGRRDRRRDDRGGGGGVRYRRDNVGLIA